MRPEAVYTALSAQCPHNAVINIRPFIVVIIWYRPYLLLFSSFDHLPIFSMKWPPLSGTPHQSPPLSCTRWGCSGVRIPVFRPPVWLRHSCGVHIFDKGLLWYRKGDTMSTHQSYWATVCHLQTAYSFWTASGCPLDVQTLLLQHGVHGGQSVCGLQSDIWSVAFCVH